MGSQSALPIIGECIYIRMNSWQAWFQSLSACIQYLCVSDFFPMIFCVFADCMQCVLLVVPIFCECVCQCTLSQRTSNLTRNGFVAVQEICCIGVVVLAWAFGKAAKRRILRVWGIWFTILLSHLSNKPGSKNVESIRENEFLTSQEILDHCLENVVNFLENVRNNRMHVSLIPRLFMIAYTTDIMCVCVCYCDFLRSSYKIFASQVHVHSSKKQYMSRSKHFGCESD